MTSPFADLDRAELLAPSSGFQKYLPNDQNQPVLTVQDPNAELIKCLEKIVTTFPPDGVWRDTAGERNGVKDGSGILLGPNGIAYIFLHLSRSHPSLSICSKPPSEWTSLYLGPSPPSCSISPLDCGMVSDEMTYCALTSTLHQSDESLDRFLSHIPSALQSGGLNTFAYGRAGLLYLCRLIKHFRPSSAPKIDPWIPKIIERILVDGPPWDKPFMDMDLIGAGHGRTGIVTQILLTDPSYAPRVVSEVEEILSWQLSNGNWPNTVPAPENTYCKDYLVQWCNGGTGVLVSLFVIRPAFNDYPDLQSRIDVAVTKMRNLVWEKGLLCKDPCLCHGITGNALAAFEPGKQRDHFLAFTAEDMYQTLDKEGIWEKADYDKPFSVLTGWVGKAVGWMFRDRPLGSSVFAYCDV